MCLPTACRRPHTICVPPCGEGSCGRAPGPPVECRSVQNTAGPPRHPMADSSTAQNVPRVSRIGKGGIPDEKPEEDRWQPDHHGGLRNGQIHSALKAEGSVANFYVQAFWARISVVMVYGYTRG